MPKKKRGFFDTLFRFTPPGFLFHQAKSAVGRIGNELKGKDKFKAERQAALGKTTGLADLLGTRATGLLNQSPSQTALFRSGKGVLADLLRDRVRSDSSAAAARGLLGSEFEIAQGAERGRTSASFLRNLLGQSETGLRFERGQAFGQAIQGRSIADNFLLGLMSEEERKNARRQAAIMGVFQALASSFAPPGSSGSFPEPKF